MTTFVPSYKKQKTLIFDEDSITNSKNCVPGPNVVFPDKKELSIGQYLENVNNIGSLGCNDNQYPKFVDNKYCCVDADERSSPQDILDYVNRMLEYAMINVNPTVFKKYLYVIDFLMYKRRVLLTTNRGLQDNLQLDENFNNIDEWYEYSKKEADAIQDYRPNPVPDSDDITIQNLTSLNTLGNKKRKIQDENYNSGGAPKKKTKKYSRNKSSRNKKKITNKKQYQHKKSYKHKKQRTYKQK
jgi:hypothetical protein